MGNPPGFWAGHPQGKSLYVSSLPWCYGILNLVNNKCALVFISMVLLMGVLWTGGRCVVESCERRLGWGDIIFFVENTVCMFYVWILFLCSVGDVSFLF